MMGCAHARPVVSGATRWLAAGVVAAIVGIAWWSLYVAPPCYPDPYEGYTHSKREHNYWGEIGQFAGSPERMVSPAEPIGELHLHDGGFEVTWAPLEVYKDYWGTYKYDPTTGAIEMTVSDGNYVPADFDGTGTMTFDAAGCLVLKDIWLGSPDPDTPIARSNGHRFRLHDLSPRVKELIRKQKARAKRSLRRSP